jgi:AraC-like DNA-binding protein
MAKGNAWKHRNDPPMGHKKRVTEKRELRSTPQYTLDDLYISPFTQRRRYDEEGRKHYVDVERNTSPTGIHVMDDYLCYLSAGQSDVRAFADRYGIRTGELAALVFILTGQKGTLFRQQYQARLADDLLRYTDLPLAEIASRSGIGSQINLYQALRRDCNMSATERRQFLREEGDEGRFIL